ncbi:MAG: CRTAC1 family protein [Acidobacteriota bacterium]
MSKNDKLEPTDRPHEHTELIDETELVPEDDAIIGVVFRRSLIVLVAIGLVVTTVALVLNRPEEEAPEQVITEAAPETVVRDIANEVPELPFTDVTGELGVDFVHESGARGEKLLPETMGGGVALFDFDDDGDADLLLTNGRRWPHDPGGAPTPSRLYRNDGDVLTDITTATGLDQVDIYATGVAVGDTDGDGDLDVFLAAVGENVLLRNDDGRLVDITREAGVGGDGTWATSAAFFDYDADGDHDLFVCNYVVWSKEIDAEVDFRLTGVGRAYGPPINYQGTFSTLYRNDDGRFVDVTEEAGIAVRNPATDVPSGKALGVLTVDIDTDGFLDIVVANDTVANFLFHNQGDGTFVESGELYGVAYGRAGEATGAMGIDVGFYRNDDELGFAIGNFANEMTSLYVTQGDPTLFADEAIGEGVGAPSRGVLSFGMLFVDLDLDGRLDIVETNGHLEDEINTVDPSQTFEQPAQVFWNAGPDGRATFVAMDEAMLGALATPVVGRASAVADLDLDGDLDLVVTQTGREPLVLRNDQALGNHWLRVVLRDPTTPGNRHAYGARLRLTTPDGVMQRRKVTPARSYQAQSELAVTFGLGTQTSVDELIVVWPDGVEETVTVDAVDRVLRVER